MQGWSVEKAFLSIYFVLNQNCPHFDHERTDSDLYFYASFVKEGNL